MSSLNLKTLACLFMIVPVLVLGGCDRDGDKNYYYDDDDSAVKSDHFSILPAGTVTHLNTLFNAANMDVFRVTQGATAIDANAALNNTEDERENTFLISPNGEWVVYVADSTVADIGQLFSIRTDGRSPATVLGGDTANAAHGIRQFRITPDGKYVVYISNQRTFGAWDLFAVPIDGSASAWQLTEDIVGGCEIIDFQLSHNSEWVVFRSNHETTIGFQEWNLYRVQVLDRTQPVLTNIRLHVVIDAATNDREVQGDYEIGLNDDYVVFRTDAIASANGEFNLYSVLLTGTGAQLNNTTLLHAFIDAVTDDRETIDFEIDPTGRYVVFRSDAEATNNGSYNLYSVRIAPNGITPPALDDLIRSHFLTDTLNEEVADYEVTSSYIVFRCDEEAANNDYNLYSVPLVPPGVTPHPLTLDNVTRLHALINTAGNLVSNWDISPNESRVVFRANDEAAENQLYGVNIAAPGVTPPALNTIRLHELLGDGFDTEEVETDFEIDPTNTYVFFRSDFDRNPLINNDNVFSLFRVSIYPATIPPNVDASTRMHTRIPRIAASVQPNFVFSPNGTYVAFHGDIYDTDQLNQYEDLHTVPVAATLPINHSQNINQVIQRSRLANNGVDREVELYNFDATSRWLVYVGDQGASSVTLANNECDEIFSVDMIGTSGVPVLGGWMMKIFAMMMLMLVSALGLRKKV